MQVKNSEMASLLIESGASVTHVDKVLVKNVVRKGRIENNILFS
jgi:hypothetical protein